MMALFHHQNEVGLGAHPALHLLGAVGAYVNACVGGQRCRCGLGTRAHYRRQASGPHFGLRQGFAQHAFCHGAAANVAHAHGHDVCNTH
jgi:hypothetical protein